MAKKRKSLMRCFGEFAGEIIKGIRTPADADREEISRRVEERTENGVTLRRTTIDEIELPTGQEPRNNQNVSD
ncbi:MAG: hypothetical protein GY894_03535 [Planctomycetes bacterium]|jgi:hypothetical protein|nr:hypothetical protein [Planctomycetota bacterium]MCP4838421.1 hypothetical protein [Planctomycetota bacterium]